MLDGVPKIRGIFVRVSHNEDRAFLGSILLRGISEVRAIQRNTTEGMWGLYWGPPILGNYQMHFYVL